jgi:hypothetical protein
VEHTKQRNKTPPDSFVLFVQEMTTEQAARNLYR